MYVNMYNNYIYMTVHVPSDSVKGGRKGEGEGERDGRERTYE